MSASEHTHCYVATAPCGCAYAIAVDTGDEDLGREVGTWISEGATVQRLSLADADAARLLTPCPHTPQYRLRRSLLTERQAADIARDAAWDIMQDSGRNALCDRLAAVVGDQSDAWWQDVSERVEQGIIDALTSIPAITSAATDTTSEPAAGNPDQLTI
jgi:hypothetical protein